MTNVTKNGRKMNYKRTDMLKENTESSPYVPFTMGVCSGLRDVSGIEVKPVASFDRGKRAWDRKLGREGDVHALQARWGLVDN